jgi:hypothetical protein
MKGAKWEQHELTQALQALTRAGISPANLAEYSDKELMGVRGVSGARVRLLRGYAASLQGKVAEATEGMTVTTGIRYLQALQGQFGVVSKDEPIFILRGQDAFAASTCDYWIDLALKLGVNREKVDSARLQFERLQEWPHKRLPD